ncbi:MAG: hypothetical protein HY921_06570 [Elusimicrobia bacterium]|nr:hypothetical protein [Elusimicrobiota bacterium]
MTLNGLIIEGVAGAGKSNILEALLKRPGFVRWLGGGLVLREEQTFPDNLMAQLREPVLTDIQHCAPLRRATQKLARSWRDDQKLKYVLERFHPSYYALMPDWRLYRNVDSALAAMNCLLVLLHFPDKEIEKRTLDRPERAHSDWKEEMLSYFGSREKALQALVESQARRFECLSLSRIPRLCIDTSDMNWDAAAEKIEEALA